MHRQVGRRVGFVVAAFLLVAATAQAEGDAAKGEQVFKKCMACHTANDKTNKVGPHLVGIVGRPVASVEGYKYSESMTAHAATVAVWDEAALNAGVKKEDERADLIAFLKTKM